MPEFLVGILYHEPVPYRLWLDGAIEDFESSTGLFVEAPDADAALAWGEIVGAALLRHVNEDPTLDWTELGYRCWIVPDPQASDWAHCLAFFPHVAEGEMPLLEQMPSAAYERWLNANFRVTQHGGLMRRFRGVSSDVLRKFRFR